MKAGSIVLKRSNSLVNIGWSVILAIVCTGILMASLWGACKLFILLSAWGCSFIVAIAITIFAWLVIFLLLFDLILDYVRNKD